jgi:NarL family two-component system response regulator LiaR
MKTVSVILVEDHRIVRQGLRHLLELEGQIEVVGEAETGEEAVSQAGLKNPDVVLMDIRIPGMDGIEATREIKRQHPNVEVIMLTSYGDEFLSDAIEAGASGYLLKSVDYKELSRSVMAVQAGGAIIDSSLGRELLRRFADMTRASRKADLTERQMHVIGMLARGLSSEEMASAAFVSRSTVKRELKRILTTLGVTTPSQAIAEARKRNLI